MSTLLSGFTQIIGTLSIGAVIGALVTILYNRGNERRKSRKENYDRRRKIYNAAQTFVSENISFANAQKELETSVVVNFDQGTEEACFLFGDKIVQYLAILRKKSELLAMTKIEIKELQQMNAREENSKKVKELLVLMEWFYAEKKRMPHEFQHYLKIDD
jgi:hypothetical protein